MVGVARIVALPLSLTSPSEAADGIIRLMPETLANKIAAGEVVQRPASALKELIENSLDAGARSVTVVVKGAGGELMQVIDDGSGMSPSDAMACLRRHATSKIRAVEDLDTLRTLGFRGEALASIGSIARVEIKTRRVEDGSGVRLAVEGGEVVANEPVATPPGTSLSVRNLFYNVPARRAFLKKPATEYRHLLDAFQTLALSHPRVAFAFLNGDEDVYRLHAHPHGSFYDALRARIRALWDDDYARELIEVEESTSYLTARGLLGRPELARKQRGLQHVFVNGRYVRNRSIEHAVRSAYEGLIGGDAHPFYVLFLDLDPRHVDVNVHPTKAEIKFDDDQGIYAFVRAVTRRAMSMGGLSVDRVTPDASTGNSLLDQAPLNEVEDETAARPTAPSMPERPSGGWSMPASPRAPSVPSPSSAGFSSSPRPQPERGGGASPLSPIEQSDLLFRPEAPTSLPSLFAGDDASAPPRASDDVLVQLHGAYILASTRSGIVIVDQQAAHERIVYERALDALQDGLALSQQMMPETYTFSAPDLALLKTLLPRLRALGFTLSVGSGRAVVVTGLPTDVSVGEAHTLLEDVLDQYREMQDDEPVAPTVALARSIAKRRALRRGTTLDSPRMRDVVDELFACATPFAAPDGRPTLIQLTLGDLDRRFGRG